MKKFKLATLAISISIILTGNAIADDLKVGEYDCTVDEVQSYMLKRSEGLRRDSAISTWEDFKTAAKTTTASSAGGTATSSTSNGTNSKDNCSSIFDSGTTLPDIEYDENSGIGKIISSILSGDIGSLAQQGIDTVVNVSDELITQMKKGICKRLSTDITKTVNGTVKDATGYSSTSILNGSAVGKAVNSQLEESLGRTGKLINVFDSGLDNSRQRAINGEINRQMKTVF